jgi:hypothetical protein
MARTFSQADFQGGFYGYPGQPGTYYRQYPFHSQNADTIATVVPTSANLLIAGAGYGYTLQALQSLGYQHLHGFDSSAWAISQKPSLVPLVQSDMTSVSSLATLPALFGLHGQQKIDWCVTEDLLPCCASDAEVATVLANLRGIATNLMHFVSVDLGQAKDAGLLWHTAAEWRALVGTTDPLYQVNGAYGPVP